MSKRDKDEAELVDGYRALSDEGKRLVKEMIGQLNFGRAIKQKALRVGGLIFNRVMLCHRYGRANVAKPSNSAKGVAERFGHADATITQSLYTHNTEKLQEKAVASFAKTLQTNH